MCGVCLCVVCVATHAHGSTLLILVLLLFLPPPSFGPNRSEPNQKNKKRAQVGSGRFVFRNRTEPNQTDLTSCFEWLTGVKGASRKKSAHFGGVEGGRYRRVVVNSPPP